MPEFACIVPIWDAKDEQYRYSSLAMMGLSQTEGDMVVYIIDNASPLTRTREVIDEYQQTYPDRFRVIHNETNLGYGPALNQGLLAAYNEGCSYFICLNNDIFYTDRVWYDSLLAPIKAGQKALVGPRLITDNEWVRTPDGSGYVAYLEGWCLAFSRQFLEEVGFFDPIYYPAWAEDVDLSWRAMRRGYQLVEVGDVGIIHAYGRTGYDGRLPNWELTRQNVAKFLAKYQAGDDGWRGPAEFRRKEPA